MLSALDGLWEHPFAAHGRPDAKLAAGSEQDALLALFGRIARWLALNPLAEPCVVAVSYADFITLQPKLNDPGTLVVKDITEGGIKRLTEIASDWNRALADGPRFPAAVNGEAPDFFVRLWLKTGNAQIKAWFEIEDRDRTPIFTMRRDTSAALQTVIEEEREASRFTENAVGSVLETTPAAVIEPLIRDIGRRGGNADEARRLFRRWYGGKWGIIVVLGLTALGVTAAYARNERFRNFVKRNIIEPLRRLTFPSKPPTPRTSTSGTTITVSPPPGWALPQVPQPRTPIMGASLNNRLYVASGQAGVEVFDVADPANARLIETIKTSDAQGVATKLPFLYVADGFNGTRVVDLRKKSDAIVATINGPPPTQHGTTVESSADVSVAIEGSHLYVLGNRSGLRVYGINDPERPQLLATTPAPNGVAVNLAVRDGKAYIARQRMLGAGAGITIVDVTDGAHPTITGHSALFEDVYQVLPLGNGVALSGETSGIRAFRYDGFEGIRYLALEKPVHALILVADGIVAAISSDDVKFIDVHDPAHLRVIPEPPIQPNRFSGLGIAYISRPTAVQPAR